MGKKSRDKDRKRGRRHDIAMAEMRPADVAWLAPRAAGVPATAAAADTNLLAGPDHMAPGSRDAIPDAAPGGPQPWVDATELAARLASLSTVLQRHLARSDAGDGLTRARLSALTLLVLGGPRPLGQLASAERVRPPTMTRLVHAMEADGLVTRERHPRDGRSVIIRATAEGEALLAEGRARQIAPLAEAISRLDGLERSQLEDASDLLGRALREASWEASDPTG